MLFAALDYQHCWLIGIKALTLVLERSDMPELRVVETSLLPHQQCNIINLLFSDGFCIHDVKAIQINELVSVVVLVNFIEYLPSDIVVNLLLHFLVLLEGDFLVNVGLVLACLILFVYLLL